MGRNLKKFAKKVSSFFSSHACTSATADEEKANIGKETKRTESRGAPLANLGNTCFLNSVLQCLIHLIPLIRIILYSNHAGPCAMRFCSFCAFKDQIAKSIKFANAVVKPMEIAKNLNAISQDFRIGKQCDAQEFLNCFLNSVEASMLSKCAKPIQITKELFGGSLKSRVWCCLCGHGSERSEPFIDLSLDIHGTTETIKDALKSFVKMEYLEGSFHCDGCNRPTSKKGKQLKLEKGPDILLLHLKRFLNNGSHVRKVSKSVQYPAELDLRPFMVSSKREEETKYDLYALVVHQGTHRQGHYFSFVRTSQHKWNLYNDSAVSAVSFDRALNQEAYILFYLRKGIASWFSDVFVKVGDPSVSPTSFFCNLKHSSSSFSPDEVNASSTVGANNNLAKILKMNKMVKRNSINSCFI